MRPAPPVFILLLASLFSDLPSLQGQAHTGVGVSGFYVSEKKSLPIGFTAFDLRAGMFRRQGIAVDYGLRLIGATTGRRGGYFAFGYFGEVLVKQAARFQPGLNLALLAGGGAAAPDRDGWMLQHTLFGNVRLTGKLSARAGINYAYVSGGIIAGFSPFAGIYWNAADLPQNQAGAVASLSLNSIYADLGAGLFNGQELALRTRK